MFEKSIISYLMVIFGIAMRTIFIATILYSSCVCTSENKPTKKGMSTKDWIIPGVISGGTIEFVNVVRKGENFKHIVTFAQRYPGFVCSRIVCFCGAYFPLLRAD